MIVIVNSKVSRASIQASLGKPEYSYYFLLKQFMPAFEHIARVIQVDSSDEVDCHYRELTACGEQVIFISVSPPQQTPIDLQCPTVCLFAWEFHDAPDQAWDGNLHDDWRYPLSRMAGAIACSQESAQAVRNLMGAGYPVVNISAPVWSHFGDLLPEGGWQACFAPRSFAFSGHILDSQTLGLSANGLVQHLPRATLCPPSSTGADSRAPGAFALSRRLYHEWRAALRQNKTQRASQPPEGAQPASHEAGTQPVQNQHIELTGVVFCSLFNPTDGRKNWIDIVTAFCWAFRDNADVTLLLKMTHHDLESYRITLLTLLSRLAPFQCRVVALHGFLDEKEYRELIRITDFYVNASNGEGLCLPLMEFLSSGKPALAPRHTAMLDYIDHEIACIVDTCEELACWSHDPAGTLRTRRHRLNWESLMLGFRDCHVIAQQTPERYQQMSASAWQRMRSFSDTPVIAQQLQGFLTPLLTRQPNGAET